MKSTSRIILIGYTTQTGPVTVQTPKSLSVTLTLVILFYILLFYFFALLPIYINIATFS